MLLFACNYVSSCDPNAEREPHEGQHDQPGLLFLAQEAQPHAIHHAKLRHLLQTSDLFLLEALGMTYVAVEADRATHAKAAEDPGGRPNSSSVSVDTHF